ncbi:MAG: ATP-binding protein [Bacteroidetes bacterium]|nr:ATP-binding protein [Bacteroidota bacterium]
MIVGRKHEKRIFSKLLDSSKSEFLAVYGRRRVGKTFLIRNYFEQKFCFQLTGLANSGLSDQLSNFYFAIKNQFPDFQDQKPKSWLEAFYQLQGCIGAESSNKKVLFIDEMPWLDTPRSGFLPAFESFWNSWASARKDIILIACGSATSWIINNLINNHGGLHNRVTQQIMLEPFTLGETHEFFQSKNIKFSLYNTIEIYMALGGIPFYLEQIEKGKSAAQNIDNLIFKEQGSLKNEFRNLLPSLFKNSENHHKILKALGKAKSGLNREMLLSKAKLANGGTATKVLEELEQCGFIKRFTPIHKKLRESLYQVIDPFTLFYFNYVEGKSTTQGDWLSQYGSHHFHAWAGYAFELVCLLHVKQIKNALGIAAVQTQIGSWHNRNAQIDLIIDRRDGIINLIEIKFSIDEFVITKSYYENLRKKLAQFVSDTKSKKAIHITFITVNDLRNNEYALELVTNGILAEELFN